MKKNINIILVLFFILCSAYSYDFSLTSIKTEENSVSVYRGKSMQTIANENFLVSMTAQKANGGIQLSTSITNFSDEKYFFDENCIKVYQGIFEENKWNDLEYEPATQYLRKEKNIATASTIMAGVALGISAANAGYSTASGSGYVNGYRYTYTANIYSSADAAIAMTNSYIALDSLQQRNSNWISFLENNLLFSSDIEAKDNYNGIFIIDEKKGPDYKIVIELSPKESFEFYFTRSDKDEILNPWKDKSHSRHSIIAGMNPFQNHYSLYYLWSRPKGVGLYAGFTGKFDAVNIPVIVELYSLDNLSYPDNWNISKIDPDSNDNFSLYNWKFDYDKTSMIYNSFGFFGGMTIKTIPNTWLLIGVGIEGYDKAYYNGDLYYKVDDDIYKYSNKTKDNSYKYYGKYWISQDCFGILFAPQIGINCITNHLDIGCMATIPIKGKFSIDITAGFAF